MKKYITKKAAIGIFNNAIKPLNNEKSRVINRDKNSMRIENEEIAIEIIVYKKYSSMAVITRDLKKQECKTQSYDIRSNVCIELSDKIFFYEAN